MHAGRASATWPPTETRPFLPRAGLSRVSFALASGIVLAPGLPQRIRRAVEKPPHSRRRGPSKARQGHFQAVQIEYVPVPYGLSGYRSRHFGEGIQMAVQRLSDIHVADLIR